MYFAPGPAPGTYWTTDGRAVLVEDNALRRKAIVRAEEVVRELRAGGTVIYHAGAYAVGVERQWEAVIPKGQPWEGRPCRVTRRTPFDPQAPIAERSARILTAEEIKAANGKALR